MILGNLVALRQTNIVRMLAYSSIAQGGFILVPLAVAGDRRRARVRRSRPCVIYLLIYAAMNLGAFAVRDRRRAAHAQSAEISSLRRARARRARRSR